MYDIMLGAGRRLECVFANFYPTRFGRLHCFWLLSLCVETYMLGEALCSARGE